MTEIIEHPREGKEIRTEITFVPVDEVVVPEKLVRPLNEDRVRMISASMKEIGLRYPITVTDTGTLVAGNHRLAAAKLLGWEKIKAEIVSEDDLDNRLWSLVENLMRHGLTELEEAECLKEYNDILVARGMRNENGGDRRSEGIKRKKNTAEVAKEIGMSKATLNRRIRIATNIGTDARDAIRNTKVADSMSEMMRLADISSAEEQLVVAQKVADGRIKTVKEVVTEMERDKQRKEFEKMSEETKKLPDNILLVNADFFEYAKTITPGSIDCIITDVPYVEEWRENIARFLIASAKVIRPGGAVITYLGHIRLPEYFEALEFIREMVKAEGKGDIVEFYWQCALVHRGHLAAVHPVGAMCGFKPVMIAMKPPKQKPYKMYNDLIEGSGREKDMHDWQQSGAELLPMIDAFTKPSDVILDPFMGAGTVGIMAKMTARKFIGVEIDKGTYELAYKAILETKCD